MGQKTTLEFINSERKILRSSWEAIRQERKPVKYSGS